MTVPFACRERFVPSGWTADGGTLEERVSDLEDVKFVPFAPPCPPRDCVCPV